MNLKSIFLFLYVCIAHLPFLFCFVPQLLEAQQVGRGRLQVFSEEQMGQ